MCGFVFCFLALFCSLSIVSIAEASKSQMGFSIDLIHHDSPLSPFHNSSMTPSELIKNAALRSIYRYNHVHLFEDEKESIETIIIPNNGEYLMRFYIGTPPVERLAIADTGSDLIWVQCSPCKNCFPQDTPLFDPKSSSTFMNVSCDSQSCKLLPRLQHGCGKSNECIYLYQYGDKSFTSGELGIDAINFCSSGEGQCVTFPGSIFGCGIYNNFTSGTNGKITGLVGLGGGQLSLISQIGGQIDHKFSYCLLPFSSTSTSKLKFGKEATITGNGVVSTPLIINPSFPTYYYLNLEAISVGQKNVKTGETDGNIVIDSGTALTILKESFYDKVVALVKEAIGVEAVQDPPKPLDFCFRYEAGKTIDFPDVVFQFTSARVPLSFEKHLVAELDNDLLCLLIVPTTEKGISIFGNVAQIDFQVEYDLERKKVSFAPTDCTKN